MTGRSRTRRYGRTIVSCSVPPEQWEVIESAIDVMDMSVSKFFVDAAYARAKQVARKMGGNDADA